MWVSNVLLAVILFAQWPSSSAQQNSGLLDLQGIDVVLSGVCCEECTDVGFVCVQQFTLRQFTVPICRRSSCTIFDNTVTNVLDNDVQTTWNIDEVYDLMPPMDINLTMFLDETKSFDRVEVFSDNESLPGEIHLYTSLNGNEFSPIGQLDKETSRLTSLQLQEDELQFTHLILELMDIVGSTVSEVFVFVQEGRNDIGCGPCVEQLIDSIQNIMALINSTRLSPTLPADVERLKLAIQSLQTSLECLEGKLLTISIVLGVEPPIDPAVELPPAVVRIDTQLIPSLPIKLDDLIGLVISIEQILFETERVSGLLNDLELALSVARNDASTIANSAEIFGNELENFRDQLLSDLESLGQAVNESSGILTVITNRNYDGITANVTQYNQRAEDTRTEAEDVLNTATENRDLLGELETALSEIESDLVSALNLAVSTEQQALESLNISTEVQRLIEEFNALLEEAKLLNTTIDSVLLEIILSLERGNNLLGEAVHNAQEAGTLLTIISPLLDSLSLQVQQYRRDLSLYQLPEPCTITFCTPGGAHAHELILNASNIVNSSESVYTVRYAVDFLENLSEREQLFNFFEVNQTAIRAQNIAQESLDMLESVNVTALLLQASNGVDASQLLRDGSLSLLARATDVEMRASDASQQYARLNSLATELFAQTENVTDTASMLLDQTGLRSEADSLFVVAERAMNKSLLTNERVTALEEGVLNVADAISQTVENVQSATQALEDAENKFDSITMFINATRLSAEQLVINVSSFIEENEQIISDIDSLIARLSDIHSRVNTINSPIQLLNAGPEESYLSLQPPPSRMINDTIQFETVDLYFLTDEQFLPPAILFYAGPIYEQEEEVSDDVSSTVGRQEEAEDYFLLSVEAMDLIQLQWSMGGESGQATLPNFDLGRSQIVITRVGSQFQLRYGVSTGGLGDPITMGTISNNSLLFQTSERTAFLFGGLPEGAQLGFPMSFLDLSEHNPFQGQLQQLLFNGDQWGLWNIRGASRTSFTGNFQRNPLATVNTWHAPRGTLTTAAAISFDGQGYLWVEQFGSVPNFNANARTMRIITRPNDERDGLVLYAYDKMMMLSMEIAYQRGDLRLIIRRHDLDTDLVNYVQIADPTIVAQTSTQGRQIEVFFIGGLGFQVNGVQFIRGSTARFFNNLQNVKVWYGGVREDLLESPFVPMITNTSYFGCVDIVTMDTVIRDVFIGAHFKRQYLNSPLQRGFSATCLRTTYTREISLDGTSGAYLSYNYLTLVDHPNSPIVAFDTDTGPTVISVAFLAQNVNGIIFAAFDENEIVYAVMRGGQLEVGIGDVLLTSVVDVSTGEWHYVLIELSDNRYTFYLDGVEQQTTNSIPGFDFQFRSSPGAGGPGLFVGGVDPGLITAIESLPPFSGCMRDFAHGFRAMSFFNLALVTDSRYPSGISYHTCLFDDDTSDPLLPVIPETLQPRTCLSPSPVILGNTVGGFHRETQLTTSNIIGLLERSWSLSMLLKQLEDGHVMTLASTMGHCITVSIRDARPVLVLSGGANATFDEQETLGERLEENVFTFLQINCEVDSIMSSLTCSLMMEGNFVGQSLQAPFSEAPFFTPLLPITFGLIPDSSGTKTQSFVGCIDDLAINNDSSGFDGVATGIPCYNSTEPGLGFTGISSIGETVSCEDVSVTLNFKALLDNGLLMMLTGNDEELTPIIAIGLFNGKVIASNFNESGVSYTLGNTTVCNSEYYDLSFASDGASFSVRLTSGDGSVDISTIPLSLPSNGSDCLLTIANIPSGLTIAQGSNLFSFLLSEDVDPDGTPPGFSGCVPNLLINNNTYQASSTTFMENVLLGLCPSN